MALSNVSFARSTPIQKPERVAWPDGIDLAPDALHEDIAGVPTSEWPSYTEESAPIDESRDWQR
jgi:hypothetical protein